MAWRTFHRSYEHLSTVQANYIRPETLHDASDVINNAVASLPIFRHYHIQEDQLHASADGQKFETHRLKPVFLEVLRYLDHGHDPGRQSQR